MGKLKSIQSLRAVAALLVFLCHLFSMEEAHAGRSEKLTSFWVNGAHGVDLFFVISGFVIVWVASDMPRGWRCAGDFLYARIARIYPLWWLFAGAVAIMHLMAFGTIWNPARMLEHGMNGPTHMVQSFLLWPQAHHPVLGVGWTLVHEIYFYVAFAALILILPATKRLAGILLWAAFVIIGATLGLTDDFADNLVKLAFYPMTLQFIAGALIAYLIKANHRRFALISIAIGLAGWAAAYLELDRIAVPSLAMWFGLEDAPAGAVVWRRTLLYGLPSALLVYGLVAMELRNGFSSRIPNPLVKIGDWRYALYLCHVPVIAGVNRLVYRPFGSDSLWSVMAYFTLATVTTFIVAAMTYYLFERPAIAFFKRHRWRPARRRTLSFGAPG
ncbi:MAG: acyltransferase [Pseudomonadota bacterium]